MKKLVALMAAFLALMLAVTSGPAQESKDDAASLVGRYRITSGMEGMRKIPPAELKPDVVHIEKDLITVYDKSKKKLYAANFTLDTSKKPWVIHMVSTEGPKAGAKSDGLIERKGDTVRVIYAVHGGQAPNDFEPEEKQNLFVMQRDDKKD